jgi:hypothetical protein
MREQEIRGIMEAYNQVYSGPEQLNEDPRNSFNPLSNASYNDRIKAERSAASKQADTGTAARVKPPAGNFQQKQQVAPGTYGTRNLYRSSSDNKVYANYNDALAARNSRLSSLKQAQTEIKKAIPGLSGLLPSSSTITPTPTPRPATGSGGSGGGTNAARPAQAASGPVLSKKNGVEGTGVGANFKPRAFTDAEKSRYASVAARNSAASGAPKVAPSSSSSSSTSSSPKPAIGTLGSTKYEIRTPTSAEFKAAQGERKLGASPEQALQAAQKTNLPTTGPSADLATARSSVASDLAKANSPAVINRPAPAGTALAKQQAQDPKKPTTVTASYKWPSEKEIVDIASAYASIYEAKKRKYEPSKDKDGDGDNDFADVMIARMIASGVPKEKAIAMTKNKSYNKKEVELVDEKYMGFKRLEASIAARGGVRNPAAVAASIGRKKYGKKKFQKAAAKGRKLDEATAMAKRGHDETAIRNKIAKSTGGGEAADRATALENQPTFGQRGVNTQARKNYARAQKGAFRDTTSSNPGLHGYAHKSDDPAVKALQNARGAQRGVLTPREKKQLNREAYEAYEFVASYLLENNFATTVEDANVIIKNMSENWFESIMEEKKPLPIAKMKAKEKKLLGSDEELGAALSTPMGSPERKKVMRNLEKFDNINTARTSISKRGGKEPHPMPEVGRYKPKYED